MDKCIKFDTMINHFKHAVRKVKEWHDVNGYEKELETFDVVRKIMVKHINRLI